MTKNTKMFSAIALAVVALGVAVYSANATSSSKDGEFANFESADKNSDGVLDRAEFSAFLKSSSAIPANNGSKAAKGGCSDGGCSGGEGGCSGGEGGCSGGAGGCSGGEGGCSGGGCSGHMESGKAAPETTTTETVAE